jgi:hypothetical protein
VDIENIRERIRAGHYLVKSHAVRHALKEGFDRGHMVEAILGGTAYTSTWYVNMPIRCTSKW